MARLTLLVPKKQAESGEAAVWIREAHQGSIERI
jgi:hypothetical protein